MDRHFSGAAADYAALMRRPWHTLRLRSTFANIVRHERPKDTWIDLGAGTGEGAVLLAHAGARVIVADPEPTMASALGRLAARTTGLSVLAPGELAGAETSAAGVTLHNVIEYSQDRAGLLGSAVSHLRPNGLLSILCANPAYSVYGLAARGAAPADLLAATCRPMTMVGMPGRRFPVPEYTVDECVAAVTTLGLRLIDHRGVRVLSDLAPEHPSQFADGWAGEMLKVEDLLGGREPLSMHVSSLAPAVPTKLRRSGPLPGSPAQQRPAGELADDHAAAPPASPR